MSGARAFLIVAVLGCASVRAVVADDSLRPVTGSESADEAITILEPVTIFSACQRPGRPGDALRWWASADYAYGWLRGATAPPLLSARPVGGGPTTVLFPGNKLNGDGRSGFQLRGGLWLDDGHSCGIEAGTLYLCESTDRAAVGNAPGTVIGRPFFNAQLGAPDVELVSLPGILSGGATVVADSSRFCGADVAFRKAICCDCRGRLDALVGYRFLSFDDSVRAFEDLQPTAEPFPPGSRITVADGFTATNRFHGLLVGLAGEYRLDPWFVEGRLGVSFGRTTREATVAGRTSFDFPPEAPVVLPGGLLALSSNSGNYSTSKFTVIPEGAIRFGYQASECFRLYAGYSVLYWPNVYRAADQIDPAVNPDLLPPPLLPVTGPTRPLFPGRASPIWAHMLSVGAELRF